MRKSCIFHPEKQKQISEGIIKEISLKDGNTAGIQITQKEALEKVQAVGTVRTAKRSTKD